MKGTVLAIPNLSAASDAETVAAVKASYEAAGATVLDEHVDHDHGRSVHTLAGTQKQLSDAVVAGWREAALGIDLRTHSGVHPHVGALDVAPFAWYDEAGRGRACATALSAAGSVGRAGGAVYLYGLLAGGRSRSDLRRGGAAGLAERAGSEALLADFGPARPSPSAGAVLIAARPPLIAFNLRLAAGSGLEGARRTAGELREGGASGLKGVRALAFELPQQGFVQLSFNLEDWERTGLGAVCEAAAERHSLVSGELIGLAPKAALEELPDWLDMPGFDADLKSVEGSLRFHGIGD